MYGMTSAIPMQCATGLLSYRLVLRLLRLYDQDGSTDRAFDLSTCSLSTFKFVFVFKLDSKLRLLSLVCRWRILFRCRIHERCRPTLLSGLCIEVIGITLPFVVIQADKGRGVSSKEVVFVIFLRVRRFLFPSDELSGVLLTITL